MQNITLLMNRNLLIFLLNLFMDNLYTFVLVPVLFSSQLFSLLFTRLWKAIISLSGLIQQSKQAKFF